MWDFKNLFIANVGVAIINFTAEYRCLRLVTGKQSRQPYFWLYYLGVALVYSWLGTVLTLEQIQAQQHYDYGIMIIAFDVAYIGLTVFLHHFIFKVVDKRMILFFGILMGLLYTLVSDIVDFLYFSVTAFIGEADIGLSGIYLARNFVCLLLLLAIIKGAEQANILNILRKSFLYPKISLLVALAIVGSQIIFLSLLPELNLANFSSGYLLSVISYGGMLLFYLFLFREYLREERLHNSEALVLQQGAYLQRLERVQQELRKIHHDYKNVATGLYAQMEAGDTVAAQEYISKQMLQLDRGLQVSIQQLNQLTNIQVIELKTLLMTKIMEAEQQQVKLVIEVMTEVTSVPMEIVDLLRCGGILLDNAIEAAAQEREKQVRVVLLKEQDRLAFVVKNPLSAAVDLQRIWTAGYSTKGSSRGLGLANLQEITQRYRNVWLETRLEEQHFVQVLNFKG